MPFFLAIIVTSFITSILSGIFGMAGGLILMGLFAWLLPITTALALHGVIQFASNAWRVVLYRRYVKWTVLLFFGLGAVAAMVAFALVSFAPTRFYVFLGLGLMPILVWLPERYVRLDAANPWQSTAGGFVSTGLSLVSGVSGPVTDLLFVRTQLTRHEVVATKAVMQAIGHASKIVAYGAVLLSTAGQKAVPLPVSIIAIIAAMAGIMVGGYVLNRMTDAHFQAGRRWIVTAVGIGFLVQAAQIALN